VRAKKKLACYDAVNALQKRRVPDVENLHPLEETQ
jgi:hypothetical protein